MISEKLSRIIGLLLLKTIEKKAVWNKTSGDSQFKLSIDNGSAITISNWSNNNNNYDAGYEVVIFNNNGDPIERYDTDLPGTSKEDYTLLQSFHKAASDSYFKVDETMDSLLESILSQDIIGNTEDVSSPPEPDDDDLPF